MLKKPEAASVLLDNALASRIVVDNALMDNWFINEPMIRYFL